MEISRPMVCHYIDSVTMPWFDDHDDPPDDLEGYHDSAMAAKWWAEKRGDLDALKLALEHILATPEIDCEGLNGALYGYEDEDMREIIDYMRKTLWPDAAPMPPGGPPGVKLVPMPLEQWWESRKGEG
jgi:hypothetical protein